MRGLSSIFFSLFRNEFNTFNNTGLRILDSIFLMTLKLLKNRISGKKMTKFGHLYGRHYISRKSVNNW